MADLYDRIRHDFTNHPPINESVVARFEACKDAAIEFGDVLIANCPGGRELSLALTNLEQALMYGRAAIARNQTGGSEERR
ncbi:MAG: hypothetical protein AB7G37_06305 [Solirubrobacteraceae bacterium]